MKAIEVETVLSPDGRLPEAFQEVFGRKVRVIVLFDTGQSGSSRATVSCFCHG